MKAQAQFIKRREKAQIEQAKIQHNNDVQKYYDQWGRITSRHEHWSTPNYYHESEEKMRKRTAAEQKQKLLKERQDKLKKFLLSETNQLDNEIRDQQREWSRHRNQNSLLESVRQTLSNAEESKKRAESESALYSRSWRLGMDQEKILRESKNNHQACAKLGWLDRQLENQLQTEQKRQENNVLELKLEQEKRKHEAFLQNCSQMRESEINQLKSFQETHITELTHRDRDLYELKLTENTLLKKSVEIQKEIDEIASLNKKRMNRMHALNNYRKIKMMMRERSEAILRDLQQDLKLLDRISFDGEFDNNEEINYLRQKFQGQQEVEAQNILSIEYMYESEAKDSLKKQEKKWQEDEMVRERQLKVLMDDRIQKINEKINECVRKQRDLQGLRETHLTAIDECNKRLKELMHASLTSGLNEVDRPFTPQTAKTEDITINNQHYELAVPKFGRKKIAWN